MGVGKDGGRGAAGLWHQALVNWPQRGRLTKDEHLSGRADVEAESHVYLVFL